METVINLNTTSLGGKWLLNIGGEILERMTVMCVSATLANRGISQSTVVFGSKEAEETYRRDSASVSSGW